MGKVFNITIYLNNERLAEYKKDQKQYNTIARQALFMELDKKIKG